MADRVYTALFPFCGLGAGALGFLRARSVGARFSILGGLDLDELACRDFERLTGAPAWRADVARISPQQLRDRYGAEPPDVVFLSPPCKGASGLLSKRDAESEKYQAMNRLAYVWIALMLAAWGEKRPRLILFENVPRLTSRASAMLADVRALLTAAGYLLHEGYHDCGEIGGLAQHRRRYLLVARHAGSVPHLLYQPPKQRVRGCGEVLGELPLPGDPAAGPMHRLPNISWLNAIRLALIPAGGDWRDLPGVVPEGKRRGSVFKRKAVERWAEPTETIAGPGSNGVENVADPRLHLSCLGAATHSSLYRISLWDSPVGTVTGATRPGQGAPSIADPRGAFHGSYGVRTWGEPAATVTGGAAVSTGPHSVADGRLALGYKTRSGTFRITLWGEPAATVTGQSGRTGHCSGGLLADPRLPLGCAPRSGVHGVSGWSTPAVTITGVASLDTGRFAVADARLSWLRLPRAYDHAYMPLDWSQPSFTVAGKTSSGCGAYAVADPRLWGRVAFGSDNPNRHWNKYHVASWWTPAGAVIGAVQVGSGAPAVADPRVPELPPHLQGYDAMTWLEAAATLEGMPGAEGPRRSKKRRSAPKKKTSPWLDPTRPRPYPTLIIAADGTWHRPLTTLELAVLQGLPAQLDGKPLVLAGGSTEQREHIGNCVPVQAAQAIAEQMLKTLATADAGEMFLSPDPVWVAPVEAMAPSPGEVSPCAP